MNSGLRRKLLVVAVLIVGVTLMIWAGVENLRQRKLKLQANQALVVPKATDASADIDRPETPKLQGKQAPDFTLTTLDGRKVSLEDYKGHPVFVNFWASWCEPCKLEMPWLEEFSKKYAAQGLVVLGISTDDASKLVVSNTVKKLGVTYPIMLKDDRVESLYDIQYDPESFYVDRNGKVVIATTGITDGQGGKDEIEANIKKLLAAGGQ